MENASKALIIAGAILLAIVIIGLGMYVYNITFNTIRESNMTQSQITTYNSEFMKYEGRQNGTAVRALCDTVREHNLVTSDTEKSKKISIEIVTVDLTGTTVTDDEDLSKTNLSNINNVKNNISSGSKYNVTFNYTSEGLVKKIGIKK